MLCGDHEKQILDGDMFRIEWLKANGYAPYVMLYDKEHIPKHSELRKLQRYVNSRQIFWSIPSFADYKRKGII